MCAEQIKTMDTAVYQPFSSILAGARERARFVVSGGTSVDDESTDGCSSGMFSSDEDADWSSDEVSFDNYSDEETTDLLMLDVYQGERWFWSPPSSMNSIQSYEDKYETASQRSADLDEFGLELSDKYYRRPTMYAIPSVDFKSDGVIDTWVNRYGSSKDDFTYVPTVPDDDDLDNGSQDSIVATGFYIPQL
ncbi:unnamed protein product [Peronospora belbahrii]|uniref:Uncharacterized protein n=1 Tax=Peronospora belbahrii TaxID=622444 RepID=A0AAU9LN66_9STRA|nr:unnamed protein product [Peronospora belbahrii]